MSLYRQQRDRRYRQVRADMQNDNLDVSVVYGNSGRLGSHSGNLAYLSKFHPFSGQQALLFPARGEPVLFAGVENQRIEALRMSSIADVHNNPLPTVPAQICDHMITPKSTGTLKAGMVITMHPMFSPGPERRLFFGKRYLATGDGYEPLKRCSDELACL